MRTLDPRGIHSSGADPFGEAQAPPDGPSPAPRFRILGLLQVHGTEQVLVTARRQQVVLALLLLNANRLVTLDGLVDGLWDGEPPATARAQVQTAVSALRRLLERAGLGERIRTRGAGYVVEVGPGELDLAVFEELVARGRAAGAARDAHRARRAFREALALWRGEPVAGVDSRLVGEHRARIAERRVAAVEECVEAELRLGLHRESIGELAVAVAEHPLRERLVGQLMTALYRSDRRVEALAAYRSLRAVLVAELGLEPSLALRQLHQDILADRAEPGPPAPAAGGVTPPVPRMLPARPQGTACHGERLDRLRRQLLAVPETAGVSVAVLTGRAGVGMSHLAVEAAHAVAGAFPDGQLYARLTDRAGRPQDIGDVLERFLRGLGHSVAEIPPDLEARAALYRSALAGRRVLILLEDAVDESQLRPLLPGDPRCPLLVTTRRRGLAPAGAVRHEIPALDVADGVRLLSWLLGAERTRVEDEAAGRLVELCGGLPLALAGAAARIAARPHWRLADLLTGLREDPTRLDQLGCHGVDLRASLRRDLDQLPVPARRLFGRLGLLPAGTCPGWMAGPLLDDAPGPAAEMLEALVDARLVEVVDGHGAATRYRLPPLERVLARELVGLRETRAERAATLRRVFGGWLTLADEAARRMHRPQLPPGRVARWALPAGVVDALLASPERWGAEARAELLAFARLAESAHEPGPCWELVVAAGATDEARRTAEWREAAEGALRGARGAGDTVGESALHRLLARGPQARGGGEARVPLRKSRPPGLFEPRRPPVGQPALIRKEPLL
ncbi:AfsR/SARP family transcriptional regulator [Streptomyces profundus]|uniref:AfsR/SARP family transcriptional regulator n=1 Tax=Streptomyces profundus TaxID=2867410 RepID=UPI001D15FE76|nr:AfsR/SARP family transcriptional regulator [Streptomyces sp. MA3_2.13]UED82964.1 winged helix-turn-helix domain-containing protein [Streptomyces sp. MA3_2.13]